MGSLEGQRAAGNETLAVRRSSSTQKVRKALWFCEFALLAVNFICITIFSRQVINEENKSIVDPTELARASTMNQWSFWTFILYVGFTVPPGFFLLKFIFSLFQVAKHLKKY